MERGILPAIAKAPSQRSLDLKSMHPRKKLAKSEGEGSEKPKTKNQKPKTKNQKKKKKKNRIPSNPTQRGYP
jgi:hypothetical protein